MHCEPAISNSTNSINISTENSRGSNSTRSQSSESSPLRYRNLASLYEELPRIEGCNQVTSDPITFEEASKHENWKLAMQEEMHMINKNQTWELASLPEGKQAIGVKWVFRTKVNPDGSIQKNKARLVVKGYSQQYGIDYTETFAPVSRLDTVKTIIAIAACKGWKLYQLDVKSAFLNGYLKEEIFVDQPQGFEIKGHEDKVLRLKKALYGLKQAPRAWYSRIDQYFMQSGFQRSPSEHTLYLKKGSGFELLIVSLYVDDLIVTGSSIGMILNFKEQMKVEFEMTDLGLLNYFLGIEVYQTSSGIFICQERYAKNLLIKFKMENCKSVSTPLMLNQKFKKEDGSGATDATQFRSIIGSLLYLSATRPDLMHATSLLSRFMQSPTQSHYAAVKRTLRYVQGTQNCGLWYKAGTEVKITGFCDSDWAGSVDDSRSTSGIVFMLGTGAITWSSHKQETVAQSTAEAEYIAGCSAVNQAIWLRRILTDLGHQQNEPTVIYCDNKSAIAISKNPVLHRRTKHILIKFHFVREAEQLGETCLMYCPSEEQLADLFTKALPGIRFEKLRKLIGVCGKSIKEEKC